MEISTPFPVWLVLKSGKSKENCNSKKNTVRIANRPPRTEQNRLHNFIIIDGREIGFKVFPFFLFLLIVYACTKSQLVAHYRPIVSRSCLERFRFCLYWPGDCVVILLLRSLCRRAHTHTLTHLLRLIAP